MSTKLIALPDWFVRNFRQVGAEGHGVLRLLQHFAQSFRLSHSQVEQLCKMAKDLIDWRELPGLKEFLRKKLQVLRTDVILSPAPDASQGRSSGHGSPQEFSGDGGKRLDWATPYRVELPQRLNTQQRQEVFTELENFYRTRQQRLPNFQGTAPCPKVPEYRFEVRFEATGGKAIGGGGNHSRADGLEGGREAEQTDHKRIPGLEVKKVGGDRILGTCPVASVKTRCCNLLTLDAIQQCGFGCSYCAIQHFYDEKSIQVNGDFAKKLEQLALDPQKWYHIGTGQAADSLLWSDKLGVLQALIDFAWNYPRVILEFKSKSANVQSLLDCDLPPNMLFTWSLNPDSFIAHEELLTAPLDARLRAARQLADRGARVGFHFHPIVRYQGWKSEYHNLCQRLAGLFRPEEVATVSLGTLTFSKSTLKTIRQKGQHSKILRFPMTEIAGKYSYPYSQKREMFVHVYQALAPWHEKIFFYLCMEDPKLWTEVFGWEYTTNQEFEQAMLASYAAKMGLK